MSDPTLTYLTAESLRSSHHGRDRNRVRQSSRIVGGGKCATCLPEPTYLPLILRRRSNFSSLPSHHGLRPGSSHSLHLPIATEVVATKNGFGRSLCHINEVREEVPVVNRPCGPDYGLCGFHIKVTNSSMSRSYSRLQISDLMPSVMV